MIPEVVLVRFYACSNALAIPHFQNDFNYENLNYKMFLSNEESTANVQCSI